jgi:hypothetical protein
MAILGGRRQYFRISVKFDQFIFSVIEAGHPVYARSGDSGLMVEENL